MTFAPVLARAAARPGRRTLWVLAAAAVAALVAAAPGGLAPAASRAALAAAGIGAAAVLLRRAPARAPAALRVIGRAPLAREAGVAVVEVDGRRLLVGWGGAGVRVLSGLADAGDPPPLVLRQAQDERTNGRSDRDARLTTGGAP